MGSVPARLSWEPQVRDGYLGNAIVQRAVRLIAEAAGSAPLAASDPTLLCLVQANSGGQGLVETLASPLQDGRAAFRQRGRNYGYISVVDVLLQQTETSTQARYTYRT